MLVVSIPQNTSDIEPGGLIPSVRGRIKSIYDQSAGTKKDGSPWSVQNIILIDGRNGIKVKAWDRDPMGVGQIAAFRRPEGGCR